MAKKIKVSRKKIKQPDEFLTFTDQAIDYLKRNRNLAYGIVTGVVLALALASFANYSFRARKAKAGRLLVEAFTILNTPLTKDLTTTDIIHGAKTYATAEERADEALQKLNEVIKNFGSGEAALEARFHLGEVYLSKGDYAKALSSYQDFLKHISAHKSDAGALLEVPAYLGMAKAYFSSGDYENARVYFQKVLDSKQDAYQAEATLGLAQALIKAGNIEQAKEKLEIILKEYPGSVYDQLAQIELNKLAGESGK